MKKAEKQKLLEKSTKTNETSLPTESSASAELVLRHSEGIKKLGTEVLNQVVKTGRATYELCKYIRENQVAPTIVSKELQELGFDKSWASKVNSVALVADELWNEYAARTLDFKKVLQLKNGVVAESLASSMGADVVEVKAAIEEMEQEESENPDLVPLTKSEEKEKLKQKVTRATASLVKCFNEAKSKKFELTIDFVRVTVVKLKAPKANKPLPEGETK